jgi:hypothetical protein
MSLDVRERAAAGPPPSLPQALVITHTKCVRLESTKFNQY